MTRRPRPRVAGKENPLTFGKKAEEVLAEAAGVKNDAGAVPEGFRRGKMKAWRKNLARRKVALDLLEHRRTDETAHDTVEGPGTGGDGR